MRTIQDRFRESIVRSFGAAGERWLSDLPGRIEELSAAWSLSVHEPLDAGGQCSWVAPVMLEDGTEAVLKVQMPHDEARVEADALRVWDGRGAVRLLRASPDGFTLLLERCEPGTDLWTLREDDGNAIGADVVERLWVAPPGDASFDRLGDVATRWSRRSYDGYPRDLVDTSASLARDLVASEPAPVLLHGDFHPGNVLRAQREPWLAIDPKPLIGDPAYDLAQFLANRCASAWTTADPVRHVRRQIDAFAERLGMDAARIGGWAVVKSLGWDWGPADARLLLDAGRI